jgi:hypothetical protein
MVPSFRAGTIDMSNVDLWGGSVVTTRESGGKVGGSDTGV